MPTRSTIRYAAKAAYQLYLMRALQGTTHCGLLCYVIANSGMVYVYENCVLVGEVKIAKAWHEL